MRPLAMLALCAALLTLGLSCGEGPPVPPDPPLSIEKQEAEAARVFGIARGLEKEGKTQEAAAAYRHIRREFPGTAHGKKAAGRGGRVP